ncbi:MULTISPECIES: hypothetical protein [unclassified Novosphingobium]|uniref:hypothetical protein n=1 Tax=unclassified Novosphingobium TaxID=2644732 RepID=UPI0006C8943E|nr:hypothetical protein [Novosphingobium sp. ST904]KPH66666.1 hypothetical protein ADT71_04695 [Novosphingobium sp. ST904]TCM26175.1 hypothetical protein EDF59_13623 [Novosphingobium sp. ST904]
MTAESHTLLQLGRLDGRLQSSPATDLWLARARLKGAVFLAELARVPITEDSLLAWICGRTPPPRRSEGLNDPLSIAALFHFALQAEETAGDPVAEASLRVLRTLLDDRAEAELYAAPDLAWFGSVFVDAKRALLTPLSSPGILPLAERLIAVHHELGLQAGTGRRVITADGRSLDIDPRTFDTVWVLGTLLPRAYVAAGLTLRALPSLVGLPRFLPNDPRVLADELQSRTLEAALLGLWELDQLELGLKRIPLDLKVTKRSKAPLLARLQLAYPDLRVPAIARLLGISPQGALKLEMKVRDLLPS